MGIFTAMEGIMWIYLRELIATLAFFGTWAVVCVFFFAFMVAP